MTKKFLKICLVLIVSIFATASKCENKVENDSISILAIGNSFSVDAMQFLYGFLEEAGYKDIHLGNLYIGGCSLERHAGNLAENKADYTYYQDSTGTWTSTASYAAIDAIKSRKWDYISMQQASNFSGQPETYEPYLSQIIAAVKENCPGAKLMWHMTWAYQADSNHSAFPNYDRDQMKMYNCIVDAVQSVIVPNEAFEFVIPCGTAVQNLRTSFLGDTITRDGFHMSYDIGRYATAMMWAKQIIGLDVAASTYRPADQNISDEAAAAVKAAVLQASENPFEIAEVVQY